MPKLDLSFGQVLILENIVPKLLGIRFVLPRMKVVWVLNLWRFGIELLLPNIFGSFSRGVRSRCSANGLNLTYSKAKVFGKSLFLVTLLGSGGRFFLLESLYFLSS